MKKINIDLRDLSSRQFWLEPLSSTTRKIMIQCIRMKDYTHESFIAALSAARPFWSVLRTDQKGFDERSNQKDLCDYKHVQEFISML